ncbi:MAG: carbon-nitrogen hydrolase family protein [Candidatus Heimdallarchaeota archaeon]
MIRVAAIQISPVFLDKKKTWMKLKEKINEAKKEGAELVTWGETLIPGYPQWLSPTGGAKFNNPDQKKAYAKYWQESIDLRDSKILDEMKALAKKHEMMFMGGISERFSGSVYCTLLTIGKNGEVLGRHRKIKPTFEERLIWADGDREGLKTHKLHDIKVGGLNCWENWLPIPRAALHLQDEMLHVAVWPGGAGLTKEITRFIALEGRSYVISVSGMLKTEDFKHLSEEEFPMKKVMMDHKGFWQNGGSMIVDPAGKTIAGPLNDEEGIIFADIDPMMVIQERQNFDISGHYSRFDLFNKP